MSVLEMHQISCKSRNFVLVKFKCQYKHLLYLKTCKCWIHMFGLVHQNLQIFFSLLIQSQWNFTLVQIGATLCSPCPRKGESTNTGTYIPCTVNRQRETSLETRTGKASPSIVNAFHLFGCTGNLWNLVQLILHRYLALLLRYKELKKC